MVLVVDTLCLQQGTQFTTPTNVSYDDWRVSAFCVCAALFCGDDVYEDSP